MLLLLLHSCQVIMFCLLDLKASLQKNEV